MIPKWYPGYYLDPKHWPEWMPEVFPHWLPASLVRTPPAIPPQSWPEPSSKPSSALFGDLLQEPRPKSLEEQLAALPNILPDISKPATPQPIADRWGGLLPLPPEPEPDARSSLSASASAAPSPRLSPRWPDYVPTTAGVPAKIAGWSWDLLRDVPALPAQWPSTSTSQFPAIPPALPVPNMESAHYWGAAPASPTEPLWNPFLASVPPAPDWEQVPMRPAGSKAEIFPQPPSPLSWSSSAAAQSDDAAATDEAAVAEEARRAAAMRTGQWDRRQTEEYEGYTAPLSAPQTDENNPDLSERQRLNLLDSYYRGTLFGAGRLALLGILDRLPDDGISPATKRVRDELRNVADLARYDRMPRFQNPSEFGAAALGEMFGGMLSPESFIGLAAKGASWLGRTLKAGVQQGTVNAATDPIVQGLNIEAGVQDKYDPWRTALASGFGFVTGATAKALAETLGHALSDKIPVAARLSGRELGEPSAEKGYRQLAMQYAKDNLAGYVVRNQETGFIIEMNWQGLKKATSGNRYDTLLKPVPAIPEMLEQGRYLRSIRDPAGRVGIKMVHLFESGADLAGTPHRSILFVRETRQGKFFYDFGIPKKD